MAYYGPCVHRSKLAAPTTKSRSSTVSLSLLFVMLQAHDSCRCNEAPEFPSFFGMTHRDMVHVSDLRVLLTPDANHTNFMTVGFFSPVAQEPFYAGLGLFELALDEWLPCFGKKSEQAALVGEVVEKL